MKLSAKFNLMFLAIFGLGLFATGLAARSFLLERAREQVLGQARLLMDASSAVREYTNKEIKPILEPLQRDTKQFFPQSVPAFSANKVFSFMREKYKDYSYREATLNPTNPEDRAADWEADIIAIFRKDASLKEFVGVRDTPAGTSLYLAKPMRALPGCLSCHGMAADAPPAMTAKYGSNNGFGWKENDVVTAQIVSAPMSVPEGVAKQALFTLMAWLAGISFVGLVALNIALSAAIVKPICRLSEVADQVSKGKLDVPEIPVKGKDEVSALADSFNRMQRSLAKAMKMLEDGE